MILSPDRALELDSLRTKNKDVLTMTKHDIQIRLHGSRWGREVCGNGNSQCRIISECAANIYKEAQLSILAFLAVGKTYLF